jgi:glutathione S-transferase
MLRLLYAPLSPFARKVRVAAFETGIDVQLDLVQVDVWNPDQPLGPDAPLGQVPVLLGGPEALPGSTLICDYFDSVSTGVKLVPAEPAARWRVLADHALADGIMVAAVAHVVERIRRPADRQWPQWLLRQESKIVQALAGLEARDFSPDRPVDLGSVTLGCALAYLDRRLPHLGWRTAHPRLARWLAEFEQRTSMQMTRFPEEKAA